MGTATLGVAEAAIDHEPVEYYQLAAPAVVTTPRIARDFVTAVLSAADRGRLIDDARVCVSDAVTNVVLHARVPVLAVEMAVHGDRVIVAVRDDDPARRPYRREARADEESGRGLMLVRSLSCESGVTLVWDGLKVIGKRVWFVLREGMAVGCAPVGR
ncbi:ATP-binding protein [Streptomyces sp. NPDC026206]|uniref:ATP-binding protein n=1 Tax=Streptomyces sp. NPDC026206 TaxID=3157089 RepID=UPI0034064163